MAIYAQEAKWVTKARNTTTYFDKAKFQEVVRFLIEYAYFEVGN